MSEESRPGPSETTRRQFIGATSGTVAAFIAGGTPVLTERVEAGAAVANSDAASLKSAVPITLRINGQDRKLRIDPRTTLLDCIRETVALTGTKKGCDHGQCGACTVHVNGKRVLSCLNLALLNDGNEITTIEGLGTPEAMHP